MKPKIQELISTQISKYVSQKMCYPQNAVILSSVNNMLSDAKVKTWDEYYFLPEILEELNWLALLTLFSLILYLHTKKICTQAELSASLPPGLNTDFQ